MYAHPDKQPSASLSETYYPKFGELQKRASQVGLVMSRDRASGHLHLRPRDTRDPRAAWRHISFQEASAIVEGFEVRAAYQARASRRN